MINMASLYPQEYIELIDLTGISSSPLSPPASQSSSIAPIAQYTQSSRLLKPNQLDEISSSHALTGVSGATSEIRTQRIQGALFGQQRIGTWPKAKASSQNRLVNEAQIFMEISFYIWHSDVKYLEELHSASHTFMPRTIPSIEDFIEKDLLPAIDLSICLFQRQERISFG
jgi:hypothetical protein